MSNDILVYNAIVENQRILKEYIDTKLFEVQFPSGGGSGPTAANTPTILYNCNGCWNGSAVIPTAVRGVFSRYEIVGHTSYWQYYCSSATFGFAGACDGACSDNFDQYCCAQCSCGFLGDRKCMNGSDSYECAGAIAWPFGCSSGCDTACTIQGFNFHVSLVPNNVCNGSQRGFHYCFAMSHNGDSNWCCIGQRNSGQAVNCCGAHPACMKSVCFTTPSATNPFACITSVMILGYGRITP